MKFNKYWFKPRRFGYGATPITLEGWVLVLVFVIYLLILSTLLTQDGNAGSYLLFFFIGIGAVWITSKKKTDGEWKWNWGKKYKEVKK